MQDLLTDIQKSELRAKRHSREQRRRKFSGKELRITLDGKQVGEITLNKPANYGCFHQLLGPTHELLQVWADDEEGPLLMASCLLKRRPQQSRVQLSSGDLIFEINFDGQYDLTLTYRPREVRTRRATVGAFATQNVRPFLVVTMILLVVAGLFLLPVLFTGPPGFRSNTDVALISPDDGAEVRIYQEFRWRTLASASSYIFSISDAATSQNLITTTVQQNSYILTDRDVSGMTNGRDYQWSVSTHVGSQEIRSSVRTFRFLRPTALNEFRDFSDSDRESIEDKVFNANYIELERLNEKLDRYLADHINTRTPDVAWTLQTQGIIFTYLDKPQFALERYSKAISIWEELGVPDALLYARCLTNYASVTQDIGDLDKSLTLYKRALTVLRTNDDKSFLTKRSTCLLNMGVLYRELGLPRQAERSYGEALEIDRRLGDLDAVADELTNRANLIVSEFEDPQRGLPLLQEAAELQRNAMKRLGEPRPTMADTLDGLAVAYSALGDQENALATWESALAIDRRRKNESGMLATTNNIANALLDELHDNKGALARYQDALKIISSKPDANPDETWRTYDGLSRVYQNLGDLQIAEGYAMKAIETIDNMRKTVSERQYRRSFNALRTGPFYGLALLRLRQGDYERAFAAIEAAKASALRDNLQQTSPNSDDTPLTLARLQQTLANDQIALEYLFGTKDDKGLLLAVDRNETILFELPKRDMLDNQIRLAVKSISKGSRSEEDGEAITALTTSIIPQKLWAKLDSQKIRTILVSPDGLLHNLPFEALARNSDRNGLDYIIKQYGISIVPSFRWWDKMKQKAGFADDSPDLLVVGNPPIDANGCRNPPPLIEEILAARSGPALQPLPFSQQEADAVIKYASKSSISMTGSKSRFDSFSGAQPERFKVIHFATHAISGGSLDNSFLLFGCSQSVDALAGSQITELKLRSQIVVLSACETDVGDTLFGEGNDSLASGFLIAGAGCVVATRWRVRDDVPVPIMETFYDRLSQGDTADEALRTAKLKYMERDSNSANWAAFNCLGYGQIRVPITVSKTIQTQRYLRRHYFAVGLVTLGLIIITWFLITVVRRKRGVS